MTNSTPVRPPLIASLTTAPKPTPAPITTKTPEPAAEKPTYSDPDRHEPDRHLWNDAKHSRRTTRFTLLTGQEIDGVVYEFGRFSIAVETALGRRVVIFKHALMSAEMV
jgi:sRNA-binding regulator protein Hfq